MPGLVTTLSDSLNFDDIRGASCLLNYKGFMCCLGQVCYQKGIDGESLRTSITPQSIWKLLDKNDILISKDETKQTYKDSALSARAMSINDNYMIPVAEKEKMLIELFAEHGIKLSFYDGPPAVKPEYGENGEFKWEYQQT